MKIYKYGIIFLLIFGSAFLIVSLRVGKLTTATRDSIYLNDAIDSSLDSAVLNIVETVDGNSLSITKEKCLSNFYRTLYACMGIADNEAAQELVQLYIPVIAFIDEESVVVHYSIIDGDKHQKVWGSEVPYSKSYLLSSGSSPDDYTQCVVNFTMTNKITVYTNGKVYTGNWEQLKKTVANENESELSLLFATEDFKSAENFDLNRDSVITQNITDTLAYYVNQHNMIARRYGEYYDFYLPESAESEIARNIDSVSFLCMVQGYPLGRGTAEVYNRFAISGTRIKPKENYYVRELDGYLYYHEADCTAGDFDDIQLYQTKEECAWTGAMPCPVCNP